MKNNYKAPMVRHFGIIILTVMIVFLATSCLALMEAVLDDMESTPRAPAIPELRLSNWHSGTIERGQTLQFRVNLGTDSFYAIQWDDSDRVHSQGALQNAADVRVGVRKEGASSYVIPIADRGNHDVSGFSYSNEHRLHRDRSPSYDANSWYIIEVEATYSGGNFRLHAY